MTGGQAIYLDEPWNKGASIHPQSPPRKEGSTFGKTLASSQTRWPSKGRQYDKSNINKKPMLAVANAYPSNTMNHIVEMSIEDLPCQIVHANPSNQVETDWKHVASSCLCSGSLNLWWGAASSPPD
jgi:hypothetical protein